jgi:hypothetical protein
LTVRAGYRTRLLSEKNFSTKWQKKGSALSQLQSLDARDLRRLSMHCEAGFSVWHFRDYHVYIRAPRSLKGLENPDHRRPAPLFWNTCRTVFEGQLRTSLKGS